MNVTKSGILDYNVSSERNGWQASESDGKEKNKSMQSHLHINILA